MPDHRTHDISTLIAAGVLGALGYGVTGAPETAALLASGTALSGLFLSPDLDILGNRGLLSILLPFGSATQVLTFALGVAAAYAGYRLSESGLIGICVGTGAFAVGWLLAPGSRPLQRWGPLVFLWAPYRLMIFAHWIFFGDKRRHPHMGHRSPLSHTPVLADIIRVAYIGSMVCVVGGVVLATTHTGDLGMVEGWIADFVSSHARESILVFSGACVATGLHQFLDQRLPDREDR